MKRLVTLFLLGCSSALAFGTPITPNLSAVKNGPISVVSSAQSLKITWDDTANQHWQTIFSLDATKPLITAISVDGRNIVELAKPYYRCSTGKRRGGWDAFFDFPPADPQGTRQFLLGFHPTTVTAQTVGDRRAFKTLDDVNNLGLHKHMIGEVDVFQISSADELYGHMNVNYLRLPELPSFDHYDRIMNSIEKGDGFITTGEILLPSISMSAEGDRSIRVKARISSTFPLRIAELVWGDGVNTHRRIIDLQSTPAFYEHEYAWLVDTPHGEPGQAGQAGVDVGAVCGLGCGRRRRVHQSDLA